MQKIDPAFLFEMGDQLRKIPTVTVETPPANAYFVLHPAANTIEQAVTGSVYWHLLRGPCRSAANALVQQMRSICGQIVALDDVENGKLQPLEVMKLQNLYGKFETLFVGDLQAGSLYLVSPKGGYDTEALIDGGLLLFSGDLPAKVPEAVADLREAARCIAFEVPTAAGFHLHRAHEAVLRVYWDNVTGGHPRPKQNNMGVYLSQLEKLDKGNKAVRLQLQGVKDFHRNPLMHPEQSLENVDQALDLLTAIRSSIGYMLREIPIGSFAPLIEMAQRVAALQEQDRAAE